VKKSNKKSVKFNPPTMINVDELAKMQEEDVIALYQSLDNDRSHVAQHHGDPMPWETELAYIQKELQYRAQNRAAHRQWEEKERIAQDLAENSYPEFEHNNFKIFEFIIKSGKYN